MFRNPQAAPPLRSPYLVGRLLGDEKAIDTVTATVALRDQMRVELDEVEAQERRKAVAESRAPNQQPNFLLAASYLVQQHSTMTAAQAVAEVRSRFIAAKVTSELRKVREKWHHEIFFRPKHFTLGDAAEKKLVEQQQLLFDEERRDIEHAQNIVYKLCNFLTCGGNLFGEWQQNFAERAARAHNENIWTANEFERAVVEIGHHVMGTEVPAGLAKTIYDFLQDKDEKELLHIDVFYRAVHEAAAQAEENKRIRVVPLQPLPQPRQQNISSPVVLPHFVKDDVYANVTSESYYVLNGKVAASDEEGEGKRKGRKDQEEDKKDKKETKETKITKPINLFDLILKDEATQNIKLPWYRRMYNRIKRPWQTKRQQRRQVEEGARLTQIKQAKLDFNEALTFWMILKDLISIHSLCSHS